MKLSKLPTLEAIEKLEKKVNKKIRTTKLSILQEIGIVIVGVVIGGLIHDLISYLIERIF